MDIISKRDFLDYTVNAGEANGKTYYSFITKGIKFIVLDANYNNDGSDYDSGNFDWKEAYIPKLQKNWLENELHTNCPVIVFIHQLLDLTQVHHNVCISNASEIIEVLERYKNVLAVFQGHHHNGSYNYANNIHFYTLKGMIEGKFPENNSFAIVSIDSSYRFSIDGFYNCEDLHF